MKIEDLAGNNIAVYDSNKERFTRFCQYLKKFKYRLRWNGDGTNVLAQRPCILVTRPNFVFLCEMALAVERNWLIVPTLSFEDFAEYERQWEIEQEKKFQKILKILDKMFQKSDAGQEYNDNSIMPPLSMQGLDGIKNIDSQKLKELFPKRDISKLRIAGGLAGEKSFKC